MLKSLPDASVDAVFTDPPYGLMSNGILEAFVKYDKRVQEDHLHYDWEIIPEWSALFEEFHRVMKPNGLLFVFGMGKSVAELFKAYHNLEEFWFEYLYPIFWDKLIHSNLFLFNTAPCSVIEEVLVFKRSYKTTTSQPKTRAYADRILDHINVPTKKTINDAMGDGRAHHFFNTKGAQYGFLTENAYEKLSDIYNLREWPEYIPYKDLKAQWDEEEKDFLSKVKFQRPEGYPAFKNLISVPKPMQDKDEEKGLHPTQKPVKLIERIFEYYVRPNTDTVIVDPFAGSGSTLIACQNFGIKGIGSELDEGYYKIATDRLDRNAERLKKETIKQEIEKRL